MSRRIAIAITGLALLAWVAFYAFRPIRVFRNRSAGMEPTVRRGEKVLMVRTQNVSDGDLIVFEYPRDPKTYLLKRVVAVGGETIEMRDKKLLRNGQELSEPYIVQDGATAQPQTRRYRTLDSFGPYKVPPGFYFVLGDNRDHSSDSRYWGPVPKKKVFGRVFTPR